MDSFKPGSGKYRKRAAKNASAENSLTQLYQSSEFGHDDLGTSGLHETKKNRKTAEAKAEENLRKSEAKAEEKALKEKRKQTGKEKAAHDLLRSERTRGILITCGIVAVASFIVLAIFHTSRSNDETDLGQKVAEPNEIYYSPLTGRLIDSPDKITAATTCVMIENSLDSRPQSGLDEAGIVYESIAEGGITRFMAIFQEAKPQYVGPVRSVRLAFAEFAKPYECSIAHVGGADNALSLIRDGRNGYRDIDAFYYEGEYYWRESSRWAPHNVYTSFEKLDALNTDRGYLTSNFNGFKRIKADTRNTPDVLDAQKIRINLSSDEYNIIYDYDKNENNYKRSFVYGGEHKVVDRDGNEKQLAPDVVIAIKLRSYLRPGSAEGYLDYQTTGSGDAFIFQDGSVTTGKWERDSVESELKFIDSNGETIPLNRGQTWITAYPDNGGSVSWE